MPLNILMPRWENKTSFLEDDSHILHNTTSKNLIKLIDLATGPHLDIYKAIEQSPDEPIHIQPNLSPCDRRKLLSV